MSWTLTVSDLNEYVRRSLAGDPMLKDLRLRGEISNFKRHVSGHLYFSLKDEQARIQCVMFRQDAVRLTFSPADGIRVELRGSVSLYTAAGSYQFYANAMSPDGLGALYQRFEELKRRLMAEGLFDAGRKRPLPVLPRMIGIVTARTGAVIHDIARVAGRRNPGIQLVLRPAQVQGAGAAEDIAQGIRELSALPGIDVIIIGRGGGSLEDLWAFNEEVVVRAVVACPIPIISAVGHEPDVLISDYVADRRASTPSNAAEIAVPDWREVRDGLDSLDIRSRQAIQRQLTQLGQRLENLRTKRVLHDPSVYIDNRRLELDYRTEKLGTAVERLLAGKRRAFETRGAALDAMSPMRVLSRGYSITEDARGKLVRSVDELSSGDAVTVRFSDGRAACSVLKTTKGE